MPVILVSVYNQYQPQVRSLEASCGGSAVGLSASPVGWWRPLASCWPRGPETLSSSWSASVSSGVWAIRLPRIIDIFQCNLVREVETFANDVHLVVIQTECIGSQISTGLGLLIQCRQFLKTR